MNEGCFCAGGGFRGERAGRRLSVVGEGEERRQRLLLRQRLRAPQLQRSSGWVEVPLHSPSATQLRRIQGHQMKRSNKSGFEAPRKAAAHASAGAII